jgi:hypothetical protein
MKITARFSSGSPFKQKPHFSALAQMWFRIWNLKSTFTIFSQTTIFFLKQAFEVSKMCFEFVTLDPNML